MEHEMVYAVLHAVNLVLSCVSRQDGARMHMYDHHASARITLGKNSAEYKSSYNHVHGSSSKPLYASSSLIFFPSHLFWVPFYTFHHIEMQCLLFSVAL